jgi:hypothetical protein
MIRMRDQIQVNKEESINRTSRICDTYPSQLLLELTDKFRTIRMSRAKQTLSVIDVSLQKTLWKRTRLGYENV